MNDENDDDDNWPHPGAYFVGSSKKRGGWCIYIMRKDESCDFAEGPFVDRAGAEFRMGQLQEAASRG